MDKFIAELEIYYAWRYWFLVIYLIHITYAAADESVTYKKEHGVTWIEATKFVVLKQVKFHILFFPMWFFFIFTKQGRKNLKKIVDRFGNATDKCDSVADMVVFVGILATVGCLMTLAVIYIGVYKYR